MPEAGGVRYQGLAFRAHHPQWAWQPESGEGACLHGGRFNPKGLPALYLSLDVKTAWLEAQQGFPFKPQPLTLCAYEVDCDDLLDLTDKTAANNRPLSDIDLTAPWEDWLDRGLEPPTQALAGQLIGSGFAGLIVPSFAPGATSTERNLVLWKWSRQTPYRVQVIDDQGRLRSFLAR